MLSPIIYEPIVRHALAEDLGRAGDLTTDAIIDANAKAEAIILCKKQGVLAGLDVACAAFHAVSQDMEVEKLSRDGDTIEPGQHLARIRGNARGILTGERTALNLLGHLCGVATITRLMADRCKPHKAQIVCTRKTTPGLRALEKHAVRMGGGANHRFGLDDAVLIKDNHIAVCGSVSEAVKRARAYAGHMVKIEVEVDTLQQLQELLEVGADVVLLDNMSPATLKQAVDMAQNRIITEASGGITPETVADVAASGVDYISVGFITHSAPNLDVGLDITM